MMSVQPPFATRKSPKIRRCEKCGLILVSTDNGQCNIFRRKSNVQYPMPWEFLDKDWFKRTAVLLIDYESGRAGIEAAKIARQHNIPVVIDIERNEPSVAGMIEISFHIVVQ